MMKRNFELVGYGIAFILMLTFLFSTALAAETDMIIEYPANGYEYEEKADGTLRIINLKEGSIPAGDYVMRVPETINGQTVTELGRFGNYRCGGTGLVEVILPKTVTRVGDDHANSPFQNCNKLKKITLYDTFEAFGYQAFMNCESLEEIEVRDSKTDEVIARWPESFRNMPNLCEIDKGAFNECKKLSCPVLVLPESVKILGSQPFDGVDFSTMYLMNPDPSGYTENFLFPNTRTNFVAVCLNKEVYQVYYDHIHPKESGNMYTQFLTYEMDVRYDQNESKPGGVKRSLWNQPLRYTEQTPSDPYSVWNKDPGYTMLDPGLIPEAGHQYFWFWDKEGKKGPVTPDHLVKSNCLYTIDKPLDPAVTVDDIDEVYTGASFPLKIHATSPLVDPEQDHSSPKEGDYSLYYAVYDFSNSKFVYKGENPNGFSVRDVKDSRPLYSPYLVTVLTLQYQSGDWKTISQTDWISTSVTIHPAEPVINPAANSPVTAGTLLKDIAISAKSGDTPGTLNWSAPDTAVIGGEGSYAWTFTPTDTENYKHPVTGTLPITGLAADKFWTVTLHNEGNIRKLSVLKGESIILPAPENKAEHFFNGWTTKEDGNGTKYENGAALIPESDLDLYAQWKEGFTVTYEIGGGAVWENLPEWIQKSAGGKYQQFVNKNAYLQRPEPAPTLEGYCLTSWKYQQCFGSHCFEQDFYFGSDPWSSQVTADITLTAQWKPAHTIRFNPNGGTGTMDPAIVPEGQYILPETSEFTRDGYSFDGWAITADGAKINNTYVMISDDTILYARWIPKTDTHYTVEHYLRNLDGKCEEYPRDKDNLTGITGDLTRAVSKEYPGFTAQPVTQDTIAGDGSTVVKIFYQRNTYTVRFYSNGGAGITADQIFTYGEEKPLTSNGFYRINHMFYCWNTRADGTGTAYENAQMVKNLTAKDKGIVNLYAMWRYTAPYVYPVAPYYPEDHIEDRIPELEKEDHFSYLQGYPDNLFGPDSSMTRGEAAQMFYNLLLNKNVPSETLFDDVPEDAWYADAVNTLAALGVVKGVDAVHYEPNRTITRAEFTVIAMRFTSSKTTARNIFSDVKKGDWFCDQVLGAVHEGWIRGYEDGTFRPNQTITRAEVTVITNRILERSADIQYVNEHTETLKLFSDVKPENWYYYDVIEATNAHQYLKKQNKECWIND